MNLDMEKGNHAKKPLFAPSIPPIVTVNVTSQIQPGTLVVGGSERHLTGLKPIVPLRKRGQSFRETTKMTASIDAEGRRHLNQ